MGYEKITIFEQYLANRMLSKLRPSDVINTVPPDRDKLVTLVAGKWRRLLFAGDGRRSVYVKKPQRYAENNRTTVLSRVSILTRDIDIANLSVCLSVHPLRSGIR